MVNDLGAGLLPAGELPNRPTVSTPKSVEEELAPHREKMKEHLSMLLEKVANNGPFCSHPDAVLKVTVDKEHWPKLVRRQYPIPHELMPLLRVVIQGWRDIGKVVRAPSGCQFNSPLLVAPKHDKSGHISGLRVCFDARQLNTYMNEYDNFPIPHIPDVLEKFKGNTLFGEFDLSEAYTQFRVTVESQPYFAFTVDKEQLMFAAAPYGIKNMPALFQRFMSTLFADMSFVFPYIDNLPFASRDWDEHEMHARMILERLDSVNMKIKASATDLATLRSPF